MVSQPLKLANKFPDFSGSPNVHHVTMCTANLLGKHVPLRAQVILPPGCQATVAGRTMAILPESAEVLFNYFAIADAASALQAKLALIKAGPNFAEALTSAPRSMSSLAAATCPLLAAK